MNKMYCLIGESNMYKRKMLLLFCLILNILMFLPSCNNFSDDKTADPSDSPEPVDVFEKDNIKVQSVPQSSKLVFGSKLLEDVELDPDDYAKGELVLINYEHPVPALYEHSPMVTLYSIRQKGLFVMKDSEISMKKVATDTINDMFNAATQAGMRKYNIYSAYRTPEYQQKLLDDAVAKLVNKGNTEEEALQTALLTIASPGNSEHHSGLSMDVGIIDENGVQLNGEAITGTPESTWLQNNSYKYGFIIRYPLEKSDITKISYEPWHLRYVGYHHAIAIFGMDQCFEEYIDYIASKGCISVAMDGKEYCRIFYYPKDTKSIKVPVGFRHEIIGTGDGYAVTVYVE